MRVARPLKLLAVGLLVWTVFPGVGALGQTEVDRAADGVARAAAQKAEIQSRVDAWAAELGTIESQVMAAVFAFNQTNAQLEQASFAVFDLRDRILQAEADVRRLRRLTETRTVEAYMSGAASGLFPIWSAANFEQSALLEEAAASGRRADADELANLADERNSLKELRESHRDAQERLTVLREETHNQSQALQAIYRSIDARYTAAFEDLKAAETAHRLAIGEWDAAQRRRAARAGIEPWRSLVEAYFPPYLVDQALQVMSCESGGNPDAVHPESDATGLFQFLAGTWVFSSANSGFSGASRFDAEASIAAAAWLVDYSIRTGHPGGAWGHWVCQP